MWEYSILVKIWRNSFMLRFINCLCAGIVTAAGHSWFIFLVLAERPQWFACSFFYSGLRRCLQLFASMIATVGQYFQPAAEGSAVFALTTEGNRGREAIYFAFCSGLGAVLLLGGIVFRTYRFYVGGLVLLLTKLVAFCWPRRWVFWSDSLLGKFWAFMTAIED
ncbi:MAG: hypothetical protein ACOX3A_02240 [bacterium]|jgi:hypothetical protein